MADLRVLVVDDNDLIVRVMEDYFRQRGDTCLTASNGPDALRLAEDRIIDLLFTDMVMPGMDGLELIKRIKVLQPQAVCVLMSGLGTRRDIISALQIGVFDFLDKPIPDLASFSMIVDRAAERSRLIRERDELLENLREQNAKLEFSLERLHEAFGQLKQQEEELELDLIKAQQVQRRFLPAALPKVEGLDFFGYFAPSEQLGGDFFGVMPLSDGRVGVYLLDVAGHGVNAALITVMLREVMRRRQREQTDDTLFAAPEKVLGLVNDALTQEAFDPPILVTMVYAVFEPSTGRVVMSAAGHPAPLLVRGSDDAHFVEIGGPILGRTISEPHATAEVVLSDGDFLLLYSDGLPEARDGQNREFSSSRLLDTIVGFHGRTAADVGRALEDARAAFLDGSPAADDVTFIVAAKPATVPSATTAQPTEVGETPSAQNQPSETIKVAVPQKLHGGRSRLNGRIKAGWNEKNCVVQYSGVATWQLAPAFREIVRQAKSGDATSIMVDLSECEAMDSTTLGLLLQQVRDVVLHRPGPRVIQQLHEMGVLEQFAIAHQPVPEIQKLMHIPVGTSDESSSELILSAHEALMEASTGNRQRFRAVIDALREHKSDAPKDGPKVE